MFDHPALPRRPARPSWPDVFRALTSLRIPTEMWKRYNAKTFRGVVPRPMFEITAQHAGVFSNRANVKVSAEGLVSVDYGSPMVMK